MFYRIFVVSALVFNYLHGYHLLPSDSQIFSSSIILNLSINLTSASEDEHRAHPYTMYTQGGREVSDFAYFE